MSNSILPCGVFKGNMKLEIITRQEVDFKSINVYAN